MKPEELFDLHKSLTSEALDIMRRKNHDYSGASGDPFANFRGSTQLGIHPVLGMMLRQQDKMMRIRTFVTKGTLQVQEEGVKDAILDQLNYLILQYAYIISEEQKNTDEYKEEMDGELGEGRGHDDTLAVVDKGWGWLP